MEMKELVRFKFKDSVIRYATTTGEPLRQVMRNGEWVTVSIDELDTLMGPEGSIALSFATALAVDAQRYNGAEAIKAHFLTTLRTPIYQELGFNDITTTPAAPSTLN